MTIALICIAYIIVVLSLMRLVHVIHIQEYRMRENHGVGNGRTGTDVPGNSKAAA